jgi:alpha-beta hydrolase superfamily lysophospholipase
MSDDLSLRQPTSAPASHLRWRLWLTRAALALVTMAALAYAAAVGYMWVRQEQLLFAPDVVSASQRLKLDDDVHEVFIDVPGAKLHALHLRLPNPRGVVFYLHGNTGSVQRWFVDADFYRRANFDLFMLDYRGYGKSSGRIENEAQLQADVRAAWQQVGLLYAGKRRVIHGRSLGTALAAQLSAAVRPELTVLVSPYSSLEALIAERHPWVPSFALRYPLHADRAVMQMRTPLMIVHGARDTFITPEHARRLASLKPDAQLVVVPDAGHGNIVDTAGYRKALSVSLEAP